MPEKGIFTMETGQVLELTKEDAKQGGYTLAQYLLMD